MKIYLKRRKLKGNKKSLFLEIREGSGHVEYESLGLNLTGNKAHDKEVLSTAKEILVKRKL